MGTKKETKALNVSPAFILLFIYLFIWFTHTSVDNVSPSVVIRREGFMTLKFVTDKNF